MAKFEIEYAQSTKVIVEAVSKEETDTLAAAMDGEETCRAGGGSSKEGKHG